MRRGNRGEGDTTIRVAGLSVGADDGPGKARRQDLRSKGLLSRLPTVGLASGAAGAFARVLRRVSKSGRSHAPAEKRPRGKLLRATPAPGELMPPGGNASPQGKPAGKVPRRAQNPTAVLRGLRNALGAAVAKASTPPQFAASALPPRRDRVYALGLLGPFVAHGLALKVSSVTSRPGARRPGEILALVRSDLLFNLGYSLFWTGLLGAARSGPARWAAVGLFHLTTILVMVVRTTAHQFFRQTGTTLDYPIIALWLPRFDQIRPMLVHGVPRVAWALLAAALSYALLGPGLLAALVGRMRGRPTAPAFQTPDARSRDEFRLCLLGIALGLLSLPARPLPRGTSKSLARDPFLNVVLTGLQRPASRDSVRSPQPVRRPASEARLVRTPRTQRRSVVLVHLESTRASSVTPYNASLKTTPFLDGLAKDSLLVERAYTTVPHTSKASVSAHCGVFPDLVQKPTESEPGGLRARGLPDLLREQGYGTVFFQSSVENFDDFGGLARNFGYKDYYPLESMDTKGFERPNYFGCEDNVMLGPSEKWLGEHGDRPFVAQYLTGTAHHDYRPPARYGRVRFSEDDLLDRYLNCVRYQDFFVANLIAQYKRLGLYEETVFVVYGDHGEGFGEHGRYGHEDVPYEEGLRIPLMVHAPGSFPGGKRVRGPANLTDVLPTVLDLLGYEVEGGEYPGYSLLRPLPEGRTLRFSCFNEGKCLASLRGSEKYVYHYDDRPDEIFDLSGDPLERRDLADERPGKAEELRRELLSWRSGANGAYAATSPEGVPASTRDGYPDGRRRSAT